MCICILKTKKGYISEERLKQAYNANPDGFGILYACHFSKDMKNFYPILKFLKGLSYKEFYDHYHEWLIHWFDDNTIFHFRTASSCGIGVEYCHPHFVNDNLAFVHNGNLFEFSSYFKGRKKDNLTDTMRFNNEILKKLPENFLENQEIFDLLNEYCINNMSKMIFMNNEGKTWILNEEAGEWKDGCWYSNKGMNNYQGYGYSGAYYYNSGDIRHKGGLPTIQFLTKEQRKHWYQCTVCGGWYHKINIGAGYKNGICDSCLLLLGLKCYIKENENCGGF